MCGDGGIELDEESKVLTFIQGVLQGVIRDRRAIASLARVVCVNVAFLANGHSASAVYVCHALASSTTYTCATCPIYFSGRAN